MILSAMVLLGAGCAPKPPRLPAGPPDPNLQICLTVAPARPRQMEPTAFTVRLQDAQQRPVAGAAVRVSLTMPSMDMGRNEAVLAPAGAGTYAGSGRFSMPGAWQATVSATKGMARSSRTFGVEVR